MNKIKEFVKNVICKHGNLIACCALAFVAVAANSACIIPFYEPEEPEGLDKFKKF